MNIRSEAWFAIYYRSHLKEELLGGIEGLIEGNAIQTRARGLPADPIRPYQKMKRTELRDYVARLQWMNHCRTFGTEEQVAKLQAELAEEVKALGK